MQIDGLSLHAAGRATPGAQPGSAPASPPKAPAAAATVTREAVAAAVESANRYLGTIGQSLRFQIDEDTGKTVVRIVDEESGEVLRQFPSDEMLAVARALERASAALLDESV